MTSMIVDHASSLFAAIVALPSRETLNTAIWALGLGLQCALLVAVFWRGVARRFPLFTALLVFYPLHAGVWFVLFGHLDNLQRDDLTNIFALAELLLLLLVAVELLLRLVGETGGWRWRRGLLPPALLAVAAGSEWAIMRALPPRMPVDRTQVFVWFLFLALFAAMVLYAVMSKGARWSNRMRIAAGFAAHALLQIAALLGLVQADLEHNAGQSLGWAYLRATAYLVVVVFWLIVLRREPARAATAAA